MFIDEEHDVCNNHHCDLPDNGEDREGFQEVHDAAGIHGPMQVEPVATGAGTKSAPTPYLNHYGY